MVKHKIPIETMDSKLFGNVYETALREAFFRIAARYPGEVLKTFFYYKPQWIVRSIVKSVIFNFNGDQTKAVNPAATKVVPYLPLAIGLLLVSLAIPLGFFSVAILSAADLWRIAA